MASIDFDKVIYSPRPREDMSLVGLRVLQELHESQQGLAKYSNILGYSEESQMFI